jgi:sporadic carbohydrate cluster protein (TIGR04323 family)
MTTRLLTYTLPRPFYGYNIPIAIQSSFIRDYANRNEYQFALPVTEVTTSNSYVMLAKMLRDAASDRVDLAVCSAFVLPVSNTDLLSKLLLGRKKQLVSIHSILESTVFTGQSFVGWAKELQELRTLSSSYTPESEVVRNALRLPGSRARRNELSFEWAKLTNRIAGCENLHMAETIRQSCLPSASFNSLS